VTWSIAGLGRDLFVRGCVWYAVYDEAGPGDA
jgi:hypothetical protein